MNARSSWQDKNTSVVCIVHANAHIHMHIKIRGSLSIVGTWVPPPLSLLLQLPPMHAPGPFLDAGHNYSYGGVSGGVLFEAPD